MPATETGAMAPPTINGETIHAWLCLAKFSIAPIIIESNVIGEFILIKLVITVFSSTKSFPNNILAISTLSCARLGSVTDPIKGLSVKVM